MISFWFWIRNSPFEQEKANLFINLFFPLLISTNNSNQFLFLNVVIFFKTNYAQSSLSKILVILVIKHKGLVCHLDLLEIFGNQHILKINIQKENIQNNNYLNSAFHMFFISIQISSHIFLNGLPSSKTIRNNELQVSRDIFQREKIHFERRVLFEINKMQARWLVSFRFRNALMAFFREIFKKRRRKRVMIKISFVYPDFDLKSI